MSSHVISSHIPFLTFLHLGRSQSEGLSGRDGVHFGPGLIGDVVHLIALCYDLCILPTPRGLHNSDSGRASESNHLLEGQKRSALQAGTYDLGGSLAPAVWLGSGQFLGG